MRQERLEAEIAKQTKTSPIAGVRAARHLEVVAERVDYRAARDTTADLDAVQAAAHLGLNEDVAPKLMARFDEAADDVEPGEISEFERIVLDGVAELPDSASRRPTPRSES
ncbi:hypothetical protein [Streptomyces sp. NPDC058401]|uniref:hypothetical protein n=1 Tax=Streptomyces sp. NPDC058401 TaxID=3346480 RepID=UPI0036665CC5